MLRFFLVIHKSFQKNLRLYCSVYSKNADYFDLNLNYHSNVKEKLNESELTVDNLENGTLYLVEVDL